MILKDSEALARLNSPMNLFNRLNGNSSNGDRKNNGLNLFMPKSDNSNVKQSEQSQPSSTFINPFEKPKTANNELTVTVKPEVVENEESKPTVDDLLGKDIDYDIKLQQAHDTAIDVLGKSLLNLADKVPHLEAKRLIDVARKASQIVDTIRKEKLERAKINSGKEVHFHFYQPEQKKISDYEVIEVG